MRHIPVFGREQYSLDRESGISVDVSKLSTLSGVHTHDFHEFFIVAEGSALHMVNNSVELVSKGDIFLIRPSDVHCYNFYRSDDFRICNIAFGDARMCELAPCSSNHLCRCFRKYYGERPSDFINRERLKYSLFLLHETDCTILEISDSCGFSNLSHFYHLFRKSFSVSSQKARKMGKCIPGSI